MQGIGSLMGGIIVMQAGKGDVEYIFTEKNFGQFATNEEVKILMRNLRISWHPNSINATA